MTSLWHHFCFLQTIVYISNSIQHTNFILGTNTQQHDAQLMIKVKVTLTDDEGHRRKSKVSTSIGSSNATRKRKALPWLVCNRKPCCFHSYKKWFGRNPAMSTFIRYYACVNRQKQFSIVTNKCEKKVLNRPTRRSLSLVSQSGAAQLFDFASSFFFALSRVASSRNNF